MKRLTTFLLFSFILSLIGTKAFAQEVYETIEIDGIVYRITNHYDGAYYDEERFDGEAEVDYCYYKDNDPRPASIILPKSIPYYGGNYLVTSIGDQVFENYYELESISLPEKLVKIGSSAFAYCSNLSSLELPNSVISIGENAFKNCRDLSTISIPEQVTYIGENAFEYCHISSITVEARKPIDISENVFEDIWSATLYVPYVSLEKYEAAEYWNCFSKILPINDFIDFEDSNVKALCLENWDTNGDGNFSVDEAAAVTDLGQVFKDNDNITTFDELRFFNGVKEIAAEEFYYCSMLSSLILPPNTECIRNEAFRGCKRLVSIVIPSKVNNIEVPAFMFCENLSFIKVDANNPIYDSREDCNAIIETDSKTLIAGCQNTIIPNEIKAIGRMAFYCQPRLESISIPDGVESIGENAFNDTGLSDVFLPNSVSEIGCEAFANTPWYESQPDGLIYTGKVAYKYKGTMPANTEISLREGTKGIAGWAFESDCKGLKSMYIPNSVTYIGPYAFDGCENMESIHLSDNISTLYYDTFSNCKSLTSLTIPEGVTHLGFPLVDGYGDAFYNCTGLTSVTIPSTVVYYVRNAFSSCSSLTSVIVNNPVPIDITIETFSNRKNATLYVPFGSKAAYDTADYWKEFKEIVEMEPVYPAIEDFAVILDGEKHTVHGRMVAQNGEEYIITDSDIYHVTGRRERLAGDGNADGKITIADVTGLVNVILGKASAESATIYNVERVEGVTGLTGDSNFIGWGGVDEDGSLDPNVKMQRQ